MTIYECVKKLYYLLTKKKSAFIFFECKISYNKLFFVLDILLESFISFLWKTCNLFYNYYYYNTNYYILVQDILLVNKIIWVKNEY